MNRARLAALAGAACLLAATAPSNATSSDPHWLTPELAAAADAAGPAGVPLPPEAVAALPQSTFAFAGVRPGTLITAEGGNIPSFCTANFVFQDAAGAFDPAQQLYLGTAGHCTSLGNTVRAVTAAPGPGTPVLVTIGTVVLDDPGGHDFALIELDPAVNDWVSPSVAHVGGPTDVYTGPTGVLVTHTGHGLLTGGQPRVGLLQQYGVGIRVTSPEAIGDSGSPVTTFDGLAVGELTNLSAGGTASVAWIEGTGRSIGTMLSVSGKALSTCPTRTPWPAPGCPPV